jgi:hypothetical protein
MRTHTETCLQTRRRATAYGALANTATVALPVSVRVSVGGGLQLTLLYAVLAYEGVRQALRWLWERRRLDVAMAAATLCTVYPNFYAFFATWNYINDSFYQMLPTQVRTRTSTQSVSKRCEGQAHVWACVCVLSEWVIDRACPHTVRLRWQSARPSCARVSGADATHAQPSMCVCVHMSVCLPVYVCAGLSVCAGGWVGGCSHRPFSP